MIMLTKLNDTKIVLNSAYIESVELIPGSKIPITNRRFSIVKDSVEERIEKTIQYNARIHGYRADR